MTRPDDDLMTRGFRLWGPVVGYMALIFWLSSRPVPPRVDRLLPDKVAHAGEYAVLGMLLVRALVGGWPRRVSVGTAVAAVLASTLYGVTDEIHQAFTLSREMDAQDLLADAIGAALAAGAMYAWGIIRPRDRVASEPHVL